MSPIRPVSRNATTYRTIGKPEFSMEEAWRKEYLTEVRKDPLWKSDPHKWLREHKESEDFFQHEILNGVHVWTMYVERLKKNEKGKIVRVPNQVRPVGRIILDDLTGLYKVEYPIGTRSWGDKAKGFKSFRLAKDRLILAQYG